MRYGIGIGIPPYNGGGSGGFQPTSVGGAILWLRADDPGIVVTGSGVSTWPNPQGLDATEPDDGDRPALVPGGWSNGLASVDFDRANLERMELSGLGATSNSYTFFAAVNQRSTGTVLQYFFGALSGADWGPQFITDTAGRIGCLDAGVHRNIADAAAGEQVLCWVVDGAGDTVEVFRNGTSIGSQPFTATVTLDTTVQLCEYQGLAGQTFDGELGEVLIYNRVISTGERANVFGYLMGKWL